MANSGVKQGDNLSPTLFNIFIDDFAKYLDKNLTDPISLNNIEINHLLYADDLVLMVQSPVSFQHCLNALQNFCKDWKLDINPNKTKVIVFCKKRSQITHFASIIVIILLKLQTSTNI
jgi:retron-type reverse transcriptase